MASFQSHNSLRTLVFLSALRNRLSYFNNLIMNLQVKTVRCPFDPNHVMPYDRFLNHLEKCKHPEKKSYIKCRYNPYHVFHKSAIDSHEKSTFFLFQSVRTDTSTKLSLTKTAGELKMRSRNPKSQLFRPLSLQIALQSKQNWPPLQKQATSPKNWWIWPKTSTTTISPANREPDDEIE